MAAAPTAVHYRLPPPPLAECDCRCTTGRRETAAAAAAEGVARGLRGEACAHPDGRVVLTDTRGRGERSGCRYGGVRACVLGGSEGDNRLPVPATHIRDSRKPPPCR